MDGLRIGKCFGTQKVAQFSPFSLFHYGLIVLKRLHADGSKHMKYNLHKRSKYASGGSIFIYYLKSSRYKHEDTDLHYPPSFFN